MILDYYRIFYYVAQYKSFSKAADVMGNNQPNITRCMNILENELGCKLFIRSNRGVQLTIEGERLFEHVSIAIEQLVSGENELLKDKGLESGLVNIGASEIALRLFLLNELEVFHHRYPHVKLRISNHSTPQAVQALENGLVDCAVVTTPVALKKPLQRIPLYSFREILIGGEEYAETASKSRSSPFSTSTRLSPAPKDFLIPCICRNIFSFLPHIHFLWSKFLSYSTAVS